MDFFRNDRVSGDIFIVVSFKNSGISVHKLDFEREKFSVMIVSSSMGMNYSFVGKAALITNSMEISKTVWVVSILVDAPLPVLAAVLPTWRLIRGTLLLLLAKYNSWQSTTLATNRTHSKVIPNTSFFYRGFF